MRLWTIAIIAAVAGVLASSAEPQSTEKWGKGMGGAVATSSPHATTAALDILSAGGNAIDAAAAAHFALMVTDPANTSLGGRVQILIALRGGELIGVDGATRAPLRLKPLAAAEDDRRGFQVAPVPGAPAALAHVVARHGRLSLAQVIEPAIALARNGFIVTPRLGASWDRARDALARDTGAAEHFLKPDGSPYRAGDRFRQSRLAVVLEQIAGSGVATFYTGAIAARIARSVSAAGGFISLADLQAYQPLDAPIVRTIYRGHDVVALGGRAWGDTLVQMFNMLEEFSLSSGPVTATELEIMARVMAQALDDRPQEIGTLKPKAGGYELSTLSSRAFARARAARIREAIEQHRISPRVDSRQDWHDTTHVAVMDRQGNAVSLTTSIGPSFGSRVASPDLGFLYAHSYRMHADPLAGARDETEMTPTVIRAKGRPMLAIGAAGSERIPTAILQVASYVLDRQMSLERAIAAPRIFSFAGTIRTQPMPPDLLEILRARGFIVQVEDVPLGTVQAVQFLGGAGEFVGAADPRYDGTAAALIR